MMICLSEFLAAVLTRYEQSVFRNTVGLSISTHPLTPEILGQSLEGWAEDVADLAITASKHSKPNLAIALHAEPIRNAGDLCVLRVKLSVTTESPDENILADFTDNLDSLSNRGCWTHCKQEAGELDILIEFGVKAELPDAVSSFPSWLYGRDVILVGYERSSDNQKLNSLFTVAGASVSYLAWEPDSTITCLSRTCDTDVRLVFIVINMQGICKDLVDYERVLERFVTAGLVVDYFDIVFLVPPGIWAELSDVIKIQVGHRLVRLPITAHLLRSPKSTLFSAPNHALQRLIREKQNHELAGIKALLVEDCSLTRSLISNYLASRGCQITAVDSGSAARHAITNSQFDVFLLDIGLPDGPGYSMVDHVRNFNPNGHQTPIIAITSSRKVTDYHNCYSHGMDDCLTKPLNFAELVSKIKCWVETGSKESNLGRHLRSATV